MSAFLKRYGLSLSALLVMALVSLYAWGRVEAPLPVHWGLSGEPDRYAGKLEALGLLPLILLGVFLLLGFLPRFDPHAERNRGVLEVVRTSVVLGLAALHVGMVGSYLGLELSIPRVAAFVVGIIFLGVGNVLPKAAPSPWLGVRTPWTFASKASWHKTQRAGGWGMTLSGLALMVVSLLDAPEIVIFSVIGLSVLVLVLVVGVTLYSYLVYRADTDRESAL